MIECQEDADRGCGMVIVTFTKSLCCKTVGSLVWQGDIKTVSKPRTNSRYSPVSNLRSLSKRRVQSDVKPKPHRTKKYLKQEDANEKVKISFSF